MPNVPAVFALIVCLLLAGGCSRAVSPLASEQDKFFAQVRAANPTEERALRYARYYSLAGRHDLAMAELERTLQKDLQNVRLLNALGNIYDQVGDYRRAQESYQKILSKDADNPLALNNLGYSHYLAGDLIQAEKVLQELVTKHPDNTVGRNNLGLVWCRQGKQHEAVALWEKKDGPEVAQVKLQQVKAFLNRGGSAMPVGNSAFPVAAAPPQSTPAATASLQEKTAEPGLVDRAEAPAGATLPARTLAAPLVAQKNPAESGAVNTRPAPPAGAQVKVDEVAMIIQPASFNPATPGASPASILSPPASSKNSYAAKAISPARHAALDHPDLVSLEEPPDVKPWRRPSRFRMITLPPVELPKTAKPLRDYITRPHSHQSLTSPATPEMAVY